MNHNDIFEYELEKLQKHHRFLDEQISRMLALTTVDRLAIQRVKREKLQLRDQISKVESKMLPDIIA